MKKMKKYNKHKFIEDTYSIHNPTDAVDAISDISSYLIAKFPEPKSLWAISSAVVNSLQAMFPDDAEFNRMKRKIAQSIMSLK